jgi:hypothetical protein
MVFRLRGNDVGSAERFLHNFLFDEVAFRTASGLPGFSRCQFLTPSRENF